MDSKRFAEAIVSMIQDIPYKLILDTDCSYMASESNFVREFLDKCTGDCCSLGNIKFGVQTPTEFLANLYGIVIREPSLFSQYLTIMGMMLR